MVKTTKRTGKETKVKETHITFDYVKLAEAIVEAEIKAKEEIETIEKKHHADKSNELLKKYGYKENKPITKFLARLKILIFAKKDDIQGDQTTLIFLKTSTEYLLILGEYFLYLFALVSMYGCITVNPQMVPYVWTTKIIYFLIAIITALIGRALRISRFEIDNMDDKDYLHAMVGSLMTVIATVIALIEVFRG